MVSFTSTLSLRNLLARIRVVHEAGSAAFSITSDSSCSESKSEENVLRVLDNPALKPVRSSLKIVSLYFVAMLAHTAENILQQENACHARRER